MIWLLTAVAVLALDQLSKWWVVTHMHPGDAQAAIPALVDLIYVQNVHGAYGLFGDKAGLLVLLAAAVLVAMWFVMRQRIARSPATRVIFGAIVGGALGNVIDRVHHGFVVDFISIRPMPFFEVFNVADACIVLGVTAFVVMGLFEREGAPRPSSSSSPTPQAPDANHA